jgi:NAD(P)-dependent dehydrogenase (short-subunit alcohol dehydrogenase family)
MSPAGRVAVVTGGGAGIGRAISVRPARDGARVAVLDIRQESAEETLGLAGGDGAAFVCDVSDSSAVHDAFARVESTLGAVDVLVNNAGAVGVDHLRRVTPRLERQRAEAAEGAVTTPLDALVRLTDDDWGRMLAIHLSGTFYCTRAAVRAMAPREQGVIVNMASICGLVGCTGHPHYSAAKAGILGFTRAAATELIVQGIRVNAVAPGHVATETLQGEISEQRRALAASTPAGRLADPDEIAGTVAFLASDDASYFVGAVLSPNGGLVTG